MVLYAVIGSWRIGFPKGKAARDFAEGGASMKTTPTSAGVAGDGHPFAGRHIACGCPGRPDHHVFGAIEQVLALRFASER